MQLLLAAAATAAADLGIVFDTDVDQQMLPPLLLLQVLT
jgi:hypothetical protein